LHSQLCCFSACLLWTGAVSFQISFQVSFQFSFFRTVVRWEFLGGVILGKTVLFLITLFVARAAFGSHRKSLARGALYGLFATQSNDFAVGLPVIKGVFAESHPSFITFFYLTGPTQVAWINPIAFAFLEAGKDRTEEEMIEQAGLTNFQMRRQAAVRVFKGVLLNPIILCTMGGLLANAIFGGVIPSPIISGSDPASPGILKTVK